MDAARWDELVAATTGIDCWCSSSAWAFAAADAFGAGVRHVWHEPGWAAWLEIVTAESESGAPIRLLTGPDPVWGFAAAFVGDVAVGGVRVGSALARERGWDVALFPGFEPGSASESAFARALSEQFRLRVGPDAPRIVASLTDGEPAWFARRSPTTRRNLRRAERAATDAGLSYETLDDEPVDAMFARLLAIEATTWKGEDGSGLLSPSMAAFCAGVMARLAPEDRRVTIARHGGADVAFIVGGVRDTTYRGLQIGYARAVRHLSVGNLLQWHEIRRLAAAGVERYDLGMDIEYKHHFGDFTYNTRSLMVVR